MPAVIGLDRFRSPKELQRHLNVSWIARRPADSPELRCPETTTRESELSPVEAVEKFRTELDTPLLIDGEVLEDGKVPVVDARPNHGITAGSSEPECGGGCECGRIEGPVDGPTRYA